MRDPEAAAGPQPLLIDIHGGPHNAWNDIADDVRLHQQELVARGWTVLLVNPRSSDSNGGSSTPPHTVPRAFWTHGTSSNRLGHSSRPSYDSDADPARRA